MVTVVTNALDLDAQGVSYYDGLGTFTGINGVSGVGLNYALMSNGSGSVPSFRQMAGGSLIWSTSSAPFVALSNMGYIVSGTGTVTLPPIPVDGDVISFIYNDTGTCTIKGNTGQKINIGSALSAVAGTAAASTQGNAVYLVYSSTYTTWFAASVIGTWTVT